ncbi:hypothetical protein E0L36_21585 [Streptomyces sp. AJS327]|nr:hypothetical protein [Streptomyces sp. AJS327]
MPDFAPVRAGRDRHRLRRLVRRGRRQIAAALAVGAAVAAFAPARSAETSDSAPTPGSSGSRPDSAAKDSGREVVSAPVRISDAATVRLLQPNDRVDVIASRSENESARVVAHHARVAKVLLADDTVPSDGALVVLAVPRRIATDLVGAAADSRLAVTLC